MRTVPLRGKKAAGRVALVDDGDYDLVSQYKWRVYQRPASERYPAAGPYAIMSIREGGRNTSLFMHCLIMGMVGVDHKNHDGLDNQRSNLRPANQSQNSQNQRPTRGGASKYKGVFLVKKSGLWRAAIGVGGRRQRRLGDFTSELEAAYAYDAAARELFGEFACPNFQDEPTSAMRDRWRKEHEERAAAVMAAGIKQAAASRSEWWSTQTPEDRNCEICGEVYQSWSTWPSKYCGSRCRSMSFRRRHAGNPETVTDRIESNPPVAGRFCVQDEFH